MAEIDLKKCIPEDTAARIVQILMKYVDNPSSKSGSKPNRSLLRSRRQYVQELIKN